MAPLMQKGKRLGALCAPGTGLGPAYLIWFHFCPEGKREREVLVLSPSQAALFIFPSWALGKFVETWKLCDLRLCPVSLSALLCKRGTIIRVFPRRCEDYMRRSLCMSPFFPLETWPCRGRDRWWEVTCMQVEVSRILAD